MNYTNGDHLLAAAGQTVDELADGTTQSDVLLAMIAARLERIAAALEAAGEGGPR